MKNKDIISILHNFAPPKLAYDWDNVGFQIGDPERHVKRVLLTLDITRNAIEKAIKKDAQLIISHHPFLFRAIKKITDRNVLKLIEHKIGVLCAHTNLDVIKNGVNKVLADRLDLSSLEFIETENKVFQIAIYVPKSHVNIIREKVFQAGMTRCENQESNPVEYSVHRQYFQSEAGKIEKEVEEIKLEFFVPAISLPGVIQTILRHHPSEKPMYAVYPQFQKDADTGLGMIGLLPEKMMLKDFAVKVKQRLNCPQVKLWLATKKETDWVKRIAICGGSGSSLISKIIGKADVFVSADFTYHTILDSPLSLIDAGHFFSEYPVLDVIENILKDEPLELIRLSAAEHEISNLIHI